MLHDVWIYEYVIKMQTKSRAASQRALQKTAYTEESGAAAHDRILYQYIKIQPRVKRVVFFIQKRASVFH